MSNRAQRRAAARAHGRGPAPLCAPGTHELGKVSATVNSETVATRVICRRCRRTFEQIVEESPGDRAMYAAFLDAERAKVEHDHEPDPDRLPVDGCAGCQRLAVLDHADFAADE